MDRSAVAPPPDDAQAVFQRALAREILRSERLRIFMLIGVLAMVLGFYLVVPTAVPWLFAGLVRGSFPVVTASLLMIAALAYEGFLLVLVT